MEKNLRRAINIFKGGSPAIVSFKPSRQTTLRQHSTAESLASFTLCLLVLKKVSFHIKINQQANKLALGKPRASPGYHANVSY